ncbi:MAG: ABC transporter ATP-binding protein [Alphaproteobacteria bacterium]|nr:ABC transporter ATP-binding protein [Alphaproteobacteria bacterium]
MTTTPLLEIEDLRTWFFTSDGVVRAVDGVSYSVAPGETLAVVGESGCGKSVTAMSVLRLLPSPPARIVSGAIRFEGRDLLTASEAEMRKIRGNEISMIFQEPMTSLNPVLTVGHQIAETLELHQGLSAADAQARAVEMLEIVRIPEAKRRAQEYPHQLSGGMRQRVMIAMAVALRPALLIADEPTTALDVTIQAQVLSLIDDLRRELGTAVLLITHDLGVVAEIAHDVAVMYAGKIVERGPVGEIFRDPAHPYTAGLMAATLDHRTANDARGQRLVELPGTVPVAGEAIPGCAFAPRCAYAVDACTQSPPEWRRLTRAHGAACPYFRAPQMAEGVAR